MDDRGPSPRWILPKATSVGSPRARATNPGSIALPCGQPYPTGSATSMRPGARLGARM